MTDWISEALTLLPGPLEPGMSTDELDAVERRFAFRFAADHRALLAAALPVGDKFPDWRGGSKLDLLRQLRRPERGVLFDVEHNDFWYDGWPSRPDDREEALRIAGRELQRVPPMVPLYSHRYLPGIGGPAGHPVLSIHQTDIISYGADLPTYLRHEFAGMAHAEAVRGASPTVPFWSDLVS